MKELYKKIYNNVLVYEREVINSSKRVDDEIHILLEPYMTELSDNELEKLKDLLSATALTAEQAGFETGVRFAVKTLIALLSD